VSENPSRPDGLSRRELLGAAITLPWWRALGLQQPARPGLMDLRASRAYAVTDGNGAAVSVTRDWTGDLCRSRIVNAGREAIRVREVVLFDLDLGLPASTTLYGESFQMLSQSGGTLGAPKDLGSYTDAKHYKIPMPAGTLTYFGAMTLFPPASDLPASPKPRSGEGWALGFTSTRRFAGLFRLTPPSGLQVIVDTEGLSLAPGQSWDLEEFSFVAGKNRDVLLGTIGAGLTANHPPLKSAAPPTGWCSWYCFGPRVTAKQVLDNLDVIATKIPGLTYVQIDDGYQPAMGDWLETGAAFGGDVRKVLDEIRKKGFQPAIWVAPFVAEAGSHLRNWQNGRLWWNDPDAIVLTGELPEDEFLFHATAIYATGGMLLSGDDLTAIAEPRMAMLKKLLPPTGVAAVFDDENLRVGTVTLPGKRMRCLFNWGDTPITLSVRLTRASTISDFWTGTAMGNSRVVTIPDMPPHSARLLECRDA
jgi:hypothetical protein